ncbi:chromate efflux transporter [Methylobacterium sp. J-030]|uniref:chromate efflux transporter n=1 Tax=Methylobacterium sp. J-030 TaxID=2836627 RepID=UPI001FB9DB6E|nr:chromate efflux transporter [Methylobacterium sp. J-030]MCJ2072898.1 chromate efflux transporter [Methylobacterium sp. J-030]
MTDAPATAEARPADAAPTGSAGEVFRAFLKLGLTAFGGPVAHLGYFRDELVVRRRWLDERGYADLVALCQFLPGPASSQVGFSLGVLRGGGLLGGLAAWTAFTLPSALLLLAFAYGAGTLTGPVAAGAIHGLKLVAVAVVAQAVWGMARTLAPDRPRAGIAVAALFVTAFAAGSVGQLGAIALGAVAGLRLCRAPAQRPEVPRAVPVSRRAGAAALVAAALLLVAPHLLAGPHAQALALFEAFYRAGALVFGGGHVVLPLLQAEVVAPGWVGPGAFLAGYGAAQAVPGPLFTVAAYLGAVAGPPPHGIAGAAIALVAIFLPGLLLVYGMLPYWDAVRTRPLAQAALRGTNAAVVGLLGAALYDPVWTGAVGNPRDLAVAVLAFVLLTVGRVPPWCVVALTALGGVALALV